MASHTRDRPLGVFPVAAIAKPFLRLTTSHEYYGLENFPMTGPAILAVNHISEIDPLIMAEFVWSRKRMFHFLAKEGLFHAPVLGPLMRRFGQVPVFRGSRGTDAMRAAKQIIKNGGIIVFYPEATLTRDPDAWPMKGKTGMVRLAHETGAPIIPVAQWGALDLLDRYAPKPKFRPRPRIRIRVGKEFSLSGYDLAKGEEVHRATDEVMLEITKELEAFRGPKPTKHLFNPAHDKGFVKPVKPKRKK